MRFLPSRLNYLTNYVPRLVKTKISNPEIKYRRGFHEPKDLVYNIDTEDIKYIFSQDYYKIRVLDAGMILDGLWESDTESQYVENSILYKSSVSRYIDGIPWSRTSYYKYHLRSLSRISLKKLQIQKNLLRLKSKFIEWDKLYHKIKEDGYKSQSNLNNGKYFDEVSIHIGKDGVLYLCQGRHRLVFARLLNVESIPVNIVARHTKWYDFVKEVYEFINKSNGKLINPITHVEFQYFPSIFGPETFNLIKNKIEKKDARILDLYCHWGYFTHEMNNLGYNCTAYLGNKDNLPFVKKLRRSKNRDFDIITGDISSCFKNEKGFDVVLLLGLFNDYKSDSKTLKILGTILDNLVTNDFFFKSKEIKSDLKSKIVMKKEDDYATFIKQNSSFSNFEFIGVSADNCPLYRFYN